MADYEGVKSACLARGQPWEDPDFPATQASVFYHQTPPFQFVWKRPAELFTKPRFLLENCNVFDVTTGRMGDKWMVSCLGVLYSSKRLFSRVVPSGQRFDSSNVGVFRFRLWWCGEWTEVLVDDRLPTVNGQLAFIRSNQTEELWPSLLEKAYAKLHGSYEALKYGCLLDGLAEVTGGITLSVPIAEATEAQFFADLLQTTSLVTCVFQPSAENLSAIPGVESALNYRMMSIEKVKCSEGHYYMAWLIRPPTLSQSPPTQLVFDAVKWRSVSARDKERLMSVPNGFWMFVCELKRAFTHIDIAFLENSSVGNESALADKRRWHVSTQQAAWRRGVTAGGCRNQIDFFHLNPQVQMTLEDGDMLIISLYQHSIMEPKVIGFSLYTLDRPLSEIAPAELFKNKRATFNSQYTNSRQISHRCRFEPGSYLILPTTFEPREEADFTLRIYSSKPVAVQMLDEKAQMLRSALVRAPSPIADNQSFAHYEAMFLQLADEHRTVDAFQLQELLDACLPNDYIKSCAHIDTCRQIVLTFDCRYSGRMSLLQFRDLMCSLKHWQGVFKAHAREKQGVVRAERLRDALHDIGFVVPRRALALLMLRYMRKDGMLRFGDFVAAVLHLQRAFDVFRSKDTAQSGSANISLSEWLKCSLMG